MSCVAPLRRQAERYLTVAAALLCLAGPAATAQTFYLPGSEYGKPFPAYPMTSGMPEPMGLNGGEPNYEQFHDLQGEFEHWGLGLAVGRLEVLIRMALGGETATAYCTATLISTDLALTNRHCLNAPNPADEVVSAQLRMGLHQNPHEPGEAFNVTLLPVEANTALDYAIVRVVGGPGAKYGTVPLDPARLRDPAPGEPLFIIHHSLGLPKMVTRRECWTLGGEEVADAVRKASTEQGGYIVSATDVIHRCDTQSGSSGALVFAQNDGSVVGLHFAGTPESRRGPNAGVSLLKRITLVANHSAVLTALLEDPDSLTETPTVTDAQPPEPPAPPATESELATRLMEGGTVHLEAGTYTLQGGLKLERSLAIVGAGVDSTNLELTGEGALLEFAGSGLLRLAGLTLKYEGESGADLIRVTSGSFEAINVHVSGGRNNLSTHELGSTDVVWGAGIQLSGTARGVVSASRISGNDIGIRAVEGASLTLRDSSIDGNGVGVLHTGSSAVIEENSCVSFEGYCMVIATKESTLRNNHINSLGGSGIVYTVANGNEGRIVDNVIVRELAVVFAQPNPLQSDEPFAPSESGIMIWVNGPGSLLLEGNDVSSSRASGIEVGENGFFSGSGPSGASIQVVRNKLHGNGGYGVNLGSTAVDGALLNNTLMNNALPGVSGSPEGWLSSGNFESGNGTLGDWGSVPVMWPPGQ